MHSLSECFFSSVVRYLDILALRFVFISHIDFHFYEFFSLSSLRTFRYALQQLPTHMYYIPNSENIAIEWQSALRFTKCILDYKFAGMHISLAIIRWIWKFQAHTVLHSLLLLRTFCSNGSNSLWLQWNGHWLEEFFCIENRYHTSPVLSLHCYATHFQLINIIPMV